MTAQNLVAVIGVVLLAACAAPTTPDQNGAQQMPSESALTSGTNRQFSYSLATKSPDEVWRLWTTPETWGEWDRGLKSASLDGDMTLGSQGEIIPLSGPRGTFTVTRFEPKQAYTFQSPLPFATLEVERFFNEDRTVFTHRVSFDGPLGFIFASFYGSGFRAVLPETMRRLNEIAEGGQ